MIRKEITVELEKGLEARPVALMVQIAGEYSSNIAVEYKDKKVNAKSIMGMMSLVIARGEKLTVIAEGEDEEKAVEGLEKYLSKKE